MARKTKLTETVIEQICGYVKLRMKTTEIGEILGIHPGTIQQWVRDGKKAKSGIKRELVDAMARADSESTADLTQIVMDTALFGSETVTEEVLRLPDGTTRTKTITKRMPSNAAEARRILALKHPDRWAETKHIKYEWKESIENIGLDPKKVEEMFFKRLAEDGESGELVIPLIEEKTV